MRPTLKDLKVLLLLLPSKGILPAVGTAIVVLLCSRMPTAVTGRGFKESWACTDLWITMPDGIWKQKGRGLRVSDFVLSFI